MEEFLLTIVGGGAVGLATAREFSRHIPPEKILVLERHTHLGQEQSGRSSEVVHSGLYDEGLKLKLCLRGNSLLRSFCHDYQVPLKMEGKLVVAKDKEEDKILEQLLHKATQNNVPEIIKIDDSKKINELEPNIKAYSALFSETTGVIDSMAYLQALLQQTENNGVYVLLGTNVTDIKPKQDGFIITLQQRDETYDIQTKAVINAAGLSADELARNINQNNLFETVPVKGLYAVAKNKGPLQIKRSVYPLPWSFEQEGRTFYDLGVHLTPTVAGNEIRIGPAVKVASSKKDYQHDISLNFFYERIVGYFPNIRREDLREGHVGILAEERNTHDFIIEPDKNFNNCIHLIGIESPGLTASLAIGEYIWNNCNPLI